MAASAAPPDSWTIPLGDLYASLNASASGLTTEDASRRQKAEGPNLLKEAPRKRLILEFLGRLANPLVLVLLFAASIAAVSGERASFVIIVAIVVCSIAIDFIQEHRAASAADALRERVALRVDVIRDGTASQVPASELAKGDVILLTAGSLVPADCRLIEARDLFVNEALLTGESYPVEKAVNIPTVSSNDDATPTNGVFMGSSIVSGTARALVVETGSRTRLGEISETLHDRAPNTAFTQGVRKFGLLIVQLTIFLVLSVLLINLLSHRPVVESFLFALALAVGLTPELLPMVVSVTLARGAVRMAASQVIVKRLSAIHDLGSMDVLCSDKTGTLTEAHIELVKEIDLEGTESQDVLRWCHVNAAFETGLKSPLDEAILRGPSFDLSGWRKIDEVPFDFERRRVSVLAEFEGRRYLVVKGAPEDVLNHCANYQLAASQKTLELNENARAKALSTLGALGRDGFRMLGVAFREVEVDRVHADISDESGLALVGFAAFLDPPKESASQALEDLRGLGIAVKILTGDNEQVTRHLCDTLHLPVKNVVNGSDLAHLTDEALLARLPDTTLFCRVTPPQKARIIRALRRRGHVVGFLGDGINDAPSLEAADVGLSVEEAVDVAKQAASMILLRHDLNILAEGVREGRRTFANIMKYVMMGTSSNFGNMFSMAGAALLLPFLPMTPIQILLNNLLYDASEIAIPFDSVDDEMIARPRHWDMNYVKKFMLVLGSVSSLFDFVTFGTLLWLFKPGESVFQTAWFVESLATQILVIFVIRTHTRPWKSPPHPALLLSSLGIVGLALVLPYTPLVAWFGFVALPWKMLLVIAIITAAYLAVAEQVKQWFLARFAQDNVRYPSPASPGRK